VVISGERTMKNLILILILVLSINISYAAQNTCSTGYACSIDKLRVLEEENNKKQNLSKENSDIKPVKLKKDDTKKEYKDFFIFIKQKE